MRMRKGKRGAIARGSGRGSRNDVQGRYMGSLDAVIWNDASMGKKEH